MPHHLVSHSSDLSRGSCILFGCLLLKAERVAAGCTADLLLCYTDYMQASPTTGELLSSPVLVKLGSLVLVGSLQAVKKYS